MTNHELETIKMRAQAAEQNGAHCVVDMATLIYLVEQTQAARIAMKPPGDADADYWRGYDEGFRDGESTAKSSKWDLES